MNAPAAAWTTNRWLGLATAAVAIGLLLFGTRSREDVRNLRSAKFRRSGGRCVHAALLTRSVAERTFEWLGRPAMFDR